MNVRSMYGQWEINEDYSGVKSQGDQEAGIRAFSMDGTMGRSVDE